MIDSWKQARAPKGRRRRTSSWWLGSGLAVTLAVLGLGLMPSRAGQAQGGAAALIQQLQARVASLTQENRRLNSQLSTERRRDAQQQQQTTQTTVRLARLWTAVNAAAVAGDPEAKAVRAANTQGVLDKLAVQFETRARAGGAASTASPPEIEPADLSGARLMGAALRGVKLVKANLTGADLRNADLTSAVVPGANLQSAKLQGATLTGADLKGADLKGALYDAQTRWPDGFNPQERGALLVK
jgi:uncharacterized protein YjbI with pentapeptide repeats